MAIPPPEREFDDYTPGESEGARRVTRNPMAIARSSSVPASMKAAPGTVSSVAEKICEKSAGAKIPASDVRLAFAP